MHWYAYEKTLSARPLWGALQTPLLVREMTSFDVDSSRSYANLGISYQFLVLRFLLLRGSVTSRRVDSKAGNTLSR